MSSSSGKGRGAARTADPREALSLHVPADHVIARATASGEGDHPWGLGATRSTAPRASEERVPADPWITSSAPLSSDGAMCQGKMEEERIQSPCGKVQALLDA